MEIFHSKCCDSSAFVKVSDFGGIMIQSKESFLFSGSLHYSWTSEMREDCVVQ